MIYFIQHLATSLIKIGCTVDLPARLYAIERQYGAIRLLGLVPGYYERENYLHKLFGSDNVIGVLDGREWFSPSKAVLAHINKYAQMTIPLPIEEPVAGARNYNTDIPNDWQPIQDTYFITGVGVKLHEKYGTELPTYKQLSLLTGINHKALKGWLFGNMSQMNIKQAQAWANLFDCKLEGFLTVGFYYIAHRDKWIEKNAQAA